MTDPNAGTPGDAGTDALAPDGGSEGGDASGLDGAIPNDGAFTCTGRDDVYCTEFSNDPSTDLWSSVNSPAIGRLDMDAGVLRAWMPAVDAGSYRHYWNRPMQGLTTNSFTIAFDYKYVGAPDMQPGFMAARMEPGGTRELVFSVAVPGALHLKKIIQATGTNDEIVLAPAIPLPEDKWAHVELSVTEADRSVTARVRAGSNPLVERRVVQALPPEFFEVDGGLAELVLGIEYVEGPRPNELLEGFDHLVVTSP